MGNSSRTSRTSLLVASGLAAAAITTVSFALGAPPVALAVDCAPASNEATLGAAIAAVNAGTCDTITFTAGTSAIALTDDLPEITKTATIAGPGRNQLTVTASEYGWAVFKATAGDLTVRDLSLVGGYLAIDADGARSATVTRVTMTGTEPLFTAVKASVNGGAVTLTDLKVTGAAAAEVKNATKVTVTRPNLTITGDYPLTIFDTVGNVTVTDPKVTINTGFSEAIWVTDTGGNVSITGADIQSTGQYSDDGIVIARTEGDVTVANATFTGVAQGVQISTTKGDVSVSEVKVDGFDGSAIDIREVDGAVTVADSEISDGTSEYSSGIEVEEVTGKLTVSNVWVSDVRFQGVQVGDADDDVEIVGVAIDGAGDDGIALGYAGQITGEAIVADSIIRDAGGSGIYVGSVGREMIVYRTTISRATEHGISALGAGGLNVVQSTIADSKEMGVVGRTVGTAWISNSTITGSRRGAVDVRLSDLLVEHSTVTGNPLVANAVVFGESVRSSGLGSIPTARLLVLNSIVTGNGAAGLFGVRTEGFDLHQLAPFATAVEYSLVPSGSSFAGSDGNVGTNAPKLGKLADNGGPTQTMLPGSGSPAINAGNPDRTGFPTTDQRGNARVAGGRVDIGSVETGTSGGGGGGGGSAASVPVDPARFLDTRGLDGNFAGQGRLPSGGIVKVPIAGVGKVPANAVGVVVNVTAIAPDGPGHTTLYPCTATPPQASHLNYGPGEVVANNTVVPLSDDGALCIYTHAGADYVVDVNGYVPPTSPVELFAPTRFLDTRDSGAVGAESHVAVQVAGRNGVPADAKAAIVSVTAVLPTGPGFVSLYPCTGDPTSASTLNYSPGQVIPNGAIVELSGDGKVCIYTYAGSHILLDVAGFVPATSSLHTLAPERLYDSRQPADRLAVGGVREIQVTGRFGIPATATAAILNVAAITPGGPGHLTVWPCGSRPNTSNLNYTAGIVRANNTLTKLSSDGTVCVFTHAAADLIVDVSGYLG